jgi:hypothetical protein
MKSALSLIVPLVLLTVCACRKTTVAPLPQHSEAARRIESVLPKNWELTESDGQIIISRKDPITFYTCTGLDVSLFGHPDLWKKYVESLSHQENYKIRLRFTRFVAFAEYARFRASNREIHVTKSTTIQVREFYEDDAIRSFDPRYRELPKYYDERSSIYRETTMGPGTCIYPDEVAIECENVLRSLESFYKLYDEDSERRALSIRMSD